MRLFHASFYFAQTLQPGFYASGTEVKWDETESNRFLYATTNRDEAVDQGFFSAMEKIGSLNRIHSSDGSILVDCDNPEELSKHMQKASIHLYCLDALISDQWVPVNNKHNGLQDEYKTAARGIKYHTHELVHYSAWSRNKKITYAKGTRRPGFLSWQ